MTAASLVLLAGLLPCTARGLERPSGATGIADPGAGASTSAVRAQVLGSLYGFRPQAAVALSGVLETLARDLADASSMDSGYHSLLCSSLIPTHGAEVATGKHLAAAADRALQTADRHPLADGEGVTPTLPVITSSSDLANSWIWAGITLLGLVVLVLIAGQCITHSSNETELNANSLRYIFLTDPHSGTAAAIFSSIMASIIMLSLLTMSFSSCHDLKIRYSNVFYGLEWMFLVVFSLETLASLMWSPSLPKALASAWTVCDILAVLPSYFDTIFAGSINADMMKMFRMIRICRLFRVKKLVGKSRNLEVLMHGLHEAAPAYGITVLVVSVTMFVPSVLIFYIEGGEWDPDMHCYRRWVGDQVMEGCSPFQNIFETMYWGISTVTTVGYGDVYPVTNMGRLVAGMTMFLGIIALAIPIGMISNSFTLAMQRLHEEGRVRVERRLSEGDRDAIARQAWKPAAEKYALMAEDVKA